MECPATDKWHNPEYAFDPLGDQRLTVLPVGLHGMIFRASAATHDGPTTIAVGGLHSAAGLRLRF